MLGGVTGVTGGALHPGDSGTGSKVAQLHEMLIDDKWYFSHALLLVAMVSFAVAIRRRGDLTGAMAAVTRIVSVIAVVITVGMTLHLLSARGVEPIADGDKTFTSRLQTLNETVVDASWGVGIASLAVAGAVAGAASFPLTCPWAGAILLAS